MNQDILKEYPDNHFDSIVTDPPYGIEFLGKDWDSNTGAVETWQECLRVLKPGGYLLAFSAARTYHHLATNIENCGFEIRDQLMWIYASGFPKAQDIGKAIQKRLGVEETTINEWASKNTLNNVLSEAQGKQRKTDKEGDKGVETPICTSPEAQQWSGWKTALKPAHEPIVMARKPFKGSTIDNVLKHGVGALNIDATRIPFVDAKDQKSANGFDDKYEGINRTGGPTFQQDQYSEYSFGAPGTGAKQDNLPPKFHPDEKGRYPANVLGEVEDYQKYFYCPKVSRKERHCGFEQDPIGRLDMVTEMGGYYVDEKGNKDESRAGNGNMIWLPHLGKIYTHGLKHEYEEWCKKNKDPLQHLGRQNHNDGWHCEDPKRKAKTTKNVGNNHPTVKPVALMKYLIQLVTPEGGRVLDPFTGSGSTGMAAVELGHEFVGCELDPNYVEIAKKRIAGWNQKTPQQQQFEKVFDATD
jgi:site-specific DNA-methyltransferase (adenine-specific)